MTNGEQRIQLLQAENRQLQQRVAELERVLEERVHAEQQAHEAMQTELRQSQALLRSVIDAIPASIIVKDPGGRYLMTNAYAAESVGQTPETVIGKTDDEIFPPEAVRELRQREQHVLATGESIERELVNTFPDGEHTILAMHFPLRNEQGIIYALGAVGLDITDRKRAEEEARIFQTLVENAPDPISIASLNGRLTYANPAMRAAFGYGDEIIGMHMADFRAESHKANASSILQHLTEHGVWQGKQEYRRADGSTFLAQVSAFMIYDNQGKPQMLMGIQRDITTQEQQAQALQQSRALLQGILDNSPFPIYAKDTQGRYILCNHQAAAMFSFTPEYVIGKTDHELFPQDVADDVTAKDQSIIATRNMEQANLNVPDDEGNMRHYMASWFPVCDDADNVYAVCGISVDVTEQQRSEAERAALQQQIIETQRATLHELSTPLIPIAEDVVIMPLIGTIDTGRAQQVLEALLEGIAEHQAETAILDITGVPLVDTQVAQSLIGAARAVRLLGARVVLTGIGPTIAQTLVHLGVDMREIITYSSLQSGVASVLHRSEPGQQQGQKRAGSALV